MNRVRQRTGRHARAVMSDHRWLLLPLAARAAWLHLTDIGDVMPELRQPCAGQSVSVNEISRLLAASPEEMSAVLGHLAERQIVEPVGTGWRLKAY